MDNPKADPSYDPNHVPPMVPFDPVKDSYVAGHWHAMGVARSTRSTHVEMRYWQLILCGIGFAMAVLFVVAAVEGWVH